MNLAIGKLILLYARTARFISPRQLLSLVAHRLIARRRTQKLSASVRISGRRLLPLKAAAVSLTSGEESRALPRANEIIHNQFRFLNHVEVLPHIDWAHDYVSPLWTYNLHYFDYARDLAIAFVQTREPRYATAMEGLINEWIESAREPNARSWDPYPTSVRIINWTIAFLLLEDALGNPFKLRMAASIYEQLSSLRGHLEWHLLGNHLQKNLVAVVMGSLLFEGADPDRWRQTAIPELWNQVDEQILQDGCHAERSPMYHSIALQDFLETIEFCKAGEVPIPQGALERIRKLSGSLRFFVRTDGELCLINDSAQNVASTPARLTALAERVLGAISPPLDGEWSLESGSFYGLRDSRNRDHLIIDAGAPSPSHQPGHAHCGVLSFELQIAGAPVVVDSGVHGYDGDPFREYVRSTRAHNTVMINGKDQSEMWGTFRIARRATVTHASWAREREEFVFTGAYRPYHLRNAEHQRIIRRSYDYVSVEDSVHGANGLPLQSFVHLHPTLSVREEAGRFVASSARVTVVIEPFGADAVRLHQGEVNPVQGWYCPEFGNAVPQVVIELFVRRNRGAGFGYRITVKNRS